MINDQQPSKDAAEDWLRQTLGDSFLPEVPTAIWQRLEPNLPEKKKRRLPVFWWLFAGGAGIVLTLIIISSRNDSQPLPIVFPQNTLPGGPDFITRESRHLAEKKAPDTAVKTASTERLQSFVPSALFKRPTSIQLPVQDFEQKIHPAKPDMSDNTAGTSRLKTLEPLQIKPLEALPSIPEFPIISVMPPHKQPKNRRFWVGVAAAPTVFFQNSRHMALSGLVFSEMPDKPAQGWEAGVSLSFELHQHWRMALGLQHFRQSYAARHTAKLRLMDGVCLNPYDPGLKEYEFRYALLAGGTQSDLTLRLQQQHAGSAMPVDEAFVLDMKTVHRSAAWRMPLSIERRFGTGRWTSFVRGGAVVEFSEKSSLKVLHFSEACQDLCFHSGHTPSIQAASAARTSLGWLVGFGMERRLNNRFALRCEPFMIGKKHGIQTGVSISLQLLK